MGTRSPFLACIVCCVVALCRRSVTLESVKTEAVNKANESAPPDALSQSPPADPYFFGRHHPDMGEGHGQLQPQAQEELRDRHVHPVAFTELVPSSVGVCTSFVDNGESADDDVSCFPHDENIGCRSDSMKVINTDSVRECLRQCRAVGNCSHYVWNKNSKRCHLKNNLPVVYTYDGDMMGPRSCKSYCYSSCMTYNMSPWKTLQLSNVPAQICHSACWATRNTCVAWSFDNGVCKLFQKGFSAYRTIGGENTVTASSELCETNPDIRIEELEDGHSLGSCLKGDDIGSRTADVMKTSTSSTKECQEQCASNSGCTHYTYNRFTKSCFTKAGQPTYYRYRGDVTGAKDCVPD